MNEGGRGRFPWEDEHPLSWHAWCRLHARRLSGGAVEAALSCGRVVHVRGAAIHVIGRREVARWRRRGIDLSRFEGVHVVCAPDGSILTVYRNRDLRGLRPRGRRRGGRPAWWGPGAPPVPRGDAGDPGDPLESGGVPVPVVLLDGAPRAGTLPAGGGASFPGWRVLYLTLAYQRVRRSARVLRVRATEAAGAAAGDADKQRGERR
jgi:hypothetical protein